MTIEKVRAVLGWCSVINIGFLLLWWLMFSFANDWIYRIHGLWFKIPAETFDAIHYGGIAAFKIAIFMFNLIPYIALRIVEQKS